MMRAPATGPTQPAGFTLVELLVAIVVLGLILTAIAGGIRFGSRAWETGGSLNAAIEEVTAAQGFLRRRIGEVAPLVADIGDNSSQIGILGDATHLRFVAPWLSPVGSGGLYLFEIALTANKDLAVGWTLLHPELVTGAPQRDGEKVLLEQVQDLDIRYFGDLDFSDTPGWQSRWADPAFLPRLVAINVRFAADDPRSWPPLIVAPQAQSVRR